MKNEKYVYLGEHWDIFDDGSSKKHHCVIEAYNILDLVKKIKDQKYVLISIDKEYALFRRHYDLHSNDSCIYIIDSIKKYYIA